MSPLTRSKSESRSSPETGDAAEAKSRDSEPPRALSTTVEIDLEVSRNRSISWTVFGIIVGILLVLRLGTVGQWVGVVLIGMGVWHAWQLVQSFLYPPGTIVVKDGEVSLPRGLCVPRPVVVKPTEVTAVYFLRRSVPWNRSAPVLVVEIGPRALAFPRDWFASEADQRHVVHALLAQSRPSSSAES